MYRIARIPSFGRGRCIAGRSVYRLAIESVTNHGTWLHLSCWAFMGCTLLLCPETAEAQRQRPDDRFGRQLDSRQEPRFDNGHGRQGDFQTRDRKFRVRDGEWEEFRYIDGSNNNLSNPNWGKARISFRRRAGSAYSDGYGEPARYVGPNARELSNVFCAQVESRPGGRGLSDMAWQWGQFLDHDLTLAETALPSEAYPILIPTGDQWFDPEATGAVRLFFFRSEYFAGTGIDMPRQQINSNTSWIDGSQIYGSDQETADYLRSFEGGRLRSSANDLLPVDDEGFFVAGDIRVNEQVGLTAMHTLFMREHNRIADRLAEFHPDWDDEELYQCARKEVIGILQAITYNEFLPAILGRDTLPHYNGYKPWMDASITNEFATAAYRFGHSMLNENLLRLDGDLQELPGGPLPLRSAFFNPLWIQADGIDPYLQGLMFQRAQEIDPMVVDDVRNFLFGAPGAGGLDLPAFNIQRGRDHGIPGYRKIRQAFGLSDMPEFQDLPMESENQQLMELMYESTDEIDPWLGLLAEQHVPGSSVGPTMQRVLVDQFVKLLRDYLGQGCWIKGRCIVDECDQRVRLAETLICEHIQLIYLC